ncbi:MFS transporter [Serratia fonticola]
MKKNIKNFDTKKWFVLAIIILMYLPVSIDATILHVAAPSLSLDLNASSNEILWIIDIYSLVMACFLLPMGVLGDKYGVKVLSFIGTVIFGAASYLAFVSDSALMLATSRGILALGAAMILPATLSALRITFRDNRERAIALGVWSAVGTGGAALGPLVGGLLLEYYSWHAVFFINIPICLITLFLILKMKISTSGLKDKKIQLFDPVLLITSIFFIILFLKTVFREGSSVAVISMLAFGVFAGYVFIRRQYTSDTPMIDMGLLRNRTVLAGIILAMTSMISLVGFEFFVSQELQLAMDMSALKAGLFLLPLIISSCFSGPCVGWAMNIIGVRAIAFFGVFLSALSFAGMSVTDFRTEVWQAWALMVCLGFCIEAALLASTTAIMNAAPADKGGEAGAIEGMAYEFGAGIGVVVFGLMMSTVFRTKFDMIHTESGTIELPESATSLADAITYAAELDEEHSLLMLSHAKAAFIDSHFIIMLVASAFLIILSGIVFYLLKNPSTADDNL